MPDKELGYERYIDSIDHSARAHESLTSYLYGLDAAPETVPIRSADRLRQFFGEMEQGAQLAKLRDVIVLLGGRAQADVMAYFSGYPESALRRSADDMAASLVELEDIMWQHADPNVVRPRAMYVHEFHEESADTYKEGIEALAERVLELTGVSAPALVARPDPEYAPMEHDADKDEYQRRIDRLLHASGMARGLSKPVEPQLTVVAPVMSRPAMPTAVVIDTVRHRRKVENKTLSGNWRGEALCADEPVIFDSELPADIKDAKELCGWCNVREACLLDALEHNDTYGTRGGLTSHERQELGRKKKSQIISGLRRAIEANEVTS